jgi:starch synthase (maltosyl-transferring)
MRKGRNNTLPANADDPGSPWAIGSDEGGHTTIDSRLGTMRDFEHFVAECNRLGMEVALDNALQCSPDHPWLTEHPEWFFIRPDGSIKHAENPPKKYQDIYPLNFWCEDREGLWNACRELFLFWIEKGVKTFRVDNPHTKPLAFWEWVLADVRKEHPDVIFLSEAFTRPKRMKGLAKLGFTQSYTYFTWRNTPVEIRDYLTELTQTEMVEYFRPNFFANTPDILHDFLQKGGRPAFRIRLLLAATLSPLYGIYSGFELCENTPLHEGSEEYLHSEKYEIRPRDYDGPGNINDDIICLNRARRENPALQNLANVRFLNSENEHILFYHKHAPGNDLLVAVNFDPQGPQSTMVSVPLMDLGLALDQPYVVEDLLTGQRYTWRGMRNYIALDPARQVGHVLRVVR